MDEWVVSSTMSINGEDIVVFFDMNDITLNYQDKIKLIRDDIEEYLFNNNLNECKVSKYCNLNIIEVQDEKVPNKINDKELIYG